MQADSLLNSDAVQVMMCMTARIVKEVFTVSLVQAFIKYQTKPGCEDEFIKSLKGVDRSQDNCISWTVTSLENGEFMEMVIYNSIDGIVADQDKGVTWLDTVDHLLMKFPNGSRTDANSGIIVDEGTKKVTE